MTADSVVRWLEDTASKPAVPDSLHPADAFPLTTFSKPPLSTDSYVDSAGNSDDGIGPHVPCANIASLVHPPNIMGDQSTANHARRRSSSLAGASGPAPVRTDPKKQRRRRSDHILEEGEDRSSDSERSDDSGNSESDDLELDDMSGDGLEDDEETGLTGRDRRRRRRRKRKNTLLDQRIVPEVKLTKEEEKLADQNMLRSMLINAVLIGLW
jgi:solute carrier family 35 protein C2